MMITFPRMGPLHVVLAGLLADLGAGVVVPPPVSKETLEIGTKYSPETACLPFKIGIGNFIQAIEQGADTVITCGGVGPCRLGYYAEVQKNILQELGYRAEFLVVEPSAASVWRTLKRLAGGRSWRQVAGAFRLAGAKLAALDELERAVCYVRPREARPGQGDAVRDQAVRELERAGSAAAVGKIAEEYRAALAGVPTDKAAEPLKVGLVGEIYVMLEPYVNQDIMRRLGRLGVEVRPTLLLGDYVRTHVLRNYRSVRCAADITAKAARYLAHPVGGHGVKSIGHAVAMGQERYDGMVHVFPFTCMPEVIARNILPKVSREEGLPVLSLAFDEQSGEAGIATRLEAFVDLLGYRRSRLS
ncbi:MAG TPA: hypothetical protein PKA10_14270 [Selenomonadales bacterium]|nr:hypothetical protein [Selenomonadales bacterium]